MLSFRHFQVVGHGLLHRKDDEECPVDRYLEWPLFRCSVVAALEGPVTYSLPIAKLGLRLAVASDYISTDIIDALEFLEISEKYNVRGIPLTVVNQESSFYGALDEDKYVESILKLA